MKFLLKMLILAVLVLPFSGLDSKAQSTKQQIEELKQQIEAIQRQNQQQIQQLQQQIELMENQRAADSEKMAEVVEKDNDAWYNKFKAGYNKGLTFSTTDGNFKMRFRIRGQFQVSVDDTDGENTATNFSVARLRMKWDGHAFRPWFLYTLQLGARDSVTLRDLYFTIAYNKNIMPRVGQFKVPFSRETLNSSSALQLVTRSIADAEFTYARDRGVTLNGGLGKNYNFSYAAGVFNGDGRNGKSTDSNLLYAGRIQLGLGGEESKFSPNSAFPTAKAYKIVPNFAKKPTFVVGLAAAGIPGLNIDRKSPNSLLTDRFEELGITQANLTSITGDVNFKMPVFNVQGSYYSRWIDPEEGGGSTAYDQGFNAQAGVFALPKTLEFVGRFTYVDFDTGSGVVPANTSVQNTAWAVTPGINYYISKDHRWKVQLQYSFLRQEFTQGEPDIDSNVIRAQLQAYF